MEGGMTHNKTTKSKLTLELNMHGLYSTKDWWIIVKTWVLHYSDCQLVVIETDCTGTAHAVRKTESTSFIMDLCV